MSRLRYFCILLLFIHHTLATTLINLIKLVKGNNIVLLCTKKIYLITIYYKMMVNSLREKIF